MELITDKFGQREIPSTVLCNPSGEELYSLSSAMYDTEITLRFNSLGEFKFKYPKSIDGGETTLPAYEYINVKRWVHIDGYGNYQIIKSEEDFDGSVPIKTVICNEAQGELMNKRVSVYGGTVKLYDSLSPSGTILDDMVKLAPGWSVFYVDAYLQTLYRTFDISDSNIFSFLMNDVATAFQCVFFFDTVNKTISAKTIENSTVETDILLSFDNVIKNSSFAEISDEITTCLAVYGGGGLNIRGVNPLGTDKIYNFDYYKNTNWMSSSLISAINDWEAVINANQAEYSSLLNQLKEKLLQKATLQSEYNVLQSELSALEVILKVKIEGGMDTTVAQQNVVAKEMELQDKASEISVAEGQITDLQSQLTDIVNLCSFSSNFTPSELIQLSSFIFENTYKNDNIIITDSMSPDAIQEQQEKLYEQAVSVLQRVSAPRYEFELDSVNFTVMEDFRVFTEQLNPGTVVTAELSDGTFVSTVLLECRFSFNEPDKLKFVFSNRLRLDGDTYVYSDLMGQVVKTGSTLSFNSEKFSNWENEYKSDVAQFIESALDMTKNELISSTKQEIKISEAGLRGRQWIEENVYSPNQVWMTSNVLAFTDDNWEHAKTAIGRISLPTGGYGYGIAGEWIMGTVIIGNQLLIQNQSSTFSIDALGATMKDGTISVISNNARILLDPDNAFLIQQNVGGSWTDKFRVSPSTGNVTYSGTLSGATGSFSGSISASSGLIGGWSISPNGLDDSTSGNYIRTNGQIKLGNLTINGSSSYFDGTFSATNLIGTIDNHQITNSLDAGKLTFGTISGGVLFAGEINWGAGARMYNYGWGISAISGNRILLMQDDSTDTMVDITGGGVSIHGQNAIILTAGGGSGTISITGEVYTDSGAGSGSTMTTIRHITTTSGDMYFKFVNGMLVDIYT